MPRKSGLIFCYAVTIVLLLMVLLPLVVTAVGSCINPALIGLSTDLWSGGSKVFDPSAFGYILENYGDWIIFSLELATACVVICLLVAVPAAYSLACHPFPGSGLVEELVALPLSLPGITLSIALLASYGEMRGPLLVLVGHLLYTIPFMVKVLTSTLRSYDVAKLENAARTLGANQWQRLVLIVLPGLKHAMTVGSLLVFAVSWGEFNVSFLLNRGRPQTFPAILYDTYTNQSIQISSAATTIFLIIVIPAVIAIQWLGGEESVDVEQGA